MRPLRGGARRVRRNAQGGDDLAHRPRAQRAIELFLADATLYLEIFGIVAIGWQWLLQAVTAAKALGANPDTADADFYRGKIHTSRYFFAYELPKIRGLAARLKESGDGITVRMKPEWFD